jgi:hypothetical protein
MEDADQFSHDPVRRSQDRRRIHEIGIYVATDVSDVPVVPDLIERGEQARNQDLKTSRHMGI